MKKLVLGACLLVAMAAVSRGDDGAAPAKKEQAGHSIGHKILFYIPNRVFDILDIVRLRVRVGPGLAAGVRISDPLSAYVGAYASVFAGLPGPRQEPSLPIPAGAESYDGATVSILHVATGVGASPNYSPTEIGVSLHLLIVGADVDVDPMEVVDFLAGLLGMDPRHDDL